MFQSTHPRRVWLGDTVFQHHHLQSFNPHTHAGCDGTQSWLAFDFVVSIHTPTQGVTLQMDVSTRHALKFQSTHPRRVWREASTYSFTFACFNPHTHAGCDRAETAYRGRGLVSIHTPTQGVTYRQAEAIITHCFNPHTHAGCDTYRPEEGWERQTVSIHTPTQGVTVCIDRLPSGASVSIHTPTQGVTLYLITYYKSANLIHCYANHHYYSTS